jgi:hypothetical protein
MIKEVDFLSSVGEACGAPPLFAFINSLNLKNKNNTGCNDNDG